MLYYALVFLVVGVIAGALNLAGVSAVAVQISWVLFLVGIVLVAIHAIAEHVEFRKPIVTDENAINMAKAFLVPEDLGTPPGAVSLCGATNFQTPQGWDTVYTPIFNMIERPIAPMLIVRVETDWFAHATEFRYVLQPGEGMSLGHTLPIGQVLFVPREEVTLVDGTESERKAFQESVSTFFREKAEHKLTTSYGLQYSPHYLRESRRQRGE